MNNVRKAVAEMLWLFLLTMKGWKCTTLKTANCTYTYQGQIVIMKKINNVLHEYVVFLF